MLWIALGGAIGSVARYWLTLWALPLSHDLPWGTIGINIGGSFLIGFFGTLTLESGRHPAPDWARLFVMVGICGGFTTFSSFSLETLELLSGGSVYWALANIGVSVLLCITSVAVGHGVASWLNGDARQIAQNTTEEEAS